MLQRILSFSSVLLVIGASLFATPGIVQARGGGGHGGGGFGGGHMGGNFGGGHIGGGFGGGHVGGFHGGFNHGGFHGGGYGYQRRNYGFYNYGYPYGFYGSGYPYYGSYGYSSYPYDYDYFQDLGSSPSINPDSNGPYTDPLPSGTNGITSAATQAQSDKIAHITVNAPADAQLSFNGTVMNSTGPVREFNSPPLAPGSRYLYQVKANWSEGGRAVTQIQQIEVMAGAHVSLTFSNSPQSAG
jgi:uncharacterized protein (TIGR03000 family)